MFTTILREPTTPLGLLVRRQPFDGPPVLYVHGATFPSALSAGYRFSGRSWMNDLNARGFDAWAFDFTGYGGSDRYPEMSGEQDGEPLGRAPQCAVQIAHVVDHICSQTGRDRVSIVAHSWGTMPAACFACTHPERIARLCFFGPVVQREPSGTNASPPAQRWRLVTTAQQLARFVEDVPPGHPPVLLDPELREWGAAYLATDPAASKRAPPAVKIPNGPAADVFSAWSGDLVYRPQDIRRPILVVRGEWDSVTRDKDASWLLSRVAAPIRRDVKIPRGTHLLHLESNRLALFDAAGEFLAGD